MKNCDDISLEEEASDKEPEPMDASSTAVGSRKATSKRKSAKEPATVQTRKKPVPKPKKGTKTSAKETPAVAGPSQPLVVTGASAPSSSPSQCTFTPPCIPSSIDELPTTIACLEKVLPSLNRSLVVDTVEEDVEEELAALALASTPDMVKYLQLSLNVLKTKSDAITKDDDSVVMGELSARREALQWYLDQYNKLLQPSAPSAPRDRDVPALTVSQAQPMFDSEAYAGMDVDIDNAFAQFGELNKF